MKHQWSLLFAFIFALIVAIFAVINVEVVEVDYLFGTAKWPLILVILGSVLMGALIVTAGGMFKYYSTLRANRLLQKENNQLKNELATLKEQPNIENDPETTENDSKQAEE